MAISSCGLRWSRASHVPCHAVSAANRAAGPRTCRVGAVLRSSLANGGRADGKILRSRDAAQPARKMLRGGTPRLCQARSPPARGRLPILRICWPSPARPRSKRLRVERRRSRRDLGAWPAAPEEEGSCIAYRQSWNPENVVRSNCLLYCEEHPMKSQLFSRFTVHCRRACDRLQ
jgi:hypothetical protein